MLLEHVFDHREFDADRLATAKRARGHTVSVCLPARDEEATVGQIVRGIREDLVETVGLVDEVVVIDDASTDETATTAERAGARVYAASEILEEEAPGSGKGDALWKSLFVTKGDLVCWLDADLRGVSSHFVTGLLGPLLTRPPIGFVKGFYNRPLDGQGGGGGRVTELVARPILSTLFPHLAAVMQPLGGEYAGRRAVLERVPFVEGWGVELGLLVDVVAEFGAGSVAQVDLGVRRHRHRPLEELAPQAMAILATALRKAGVEPGEGWGEDLVRGVGGHRLERVEVETRERRPMIEVPAYVRLREASA